VLEDAGLPISAVSGTVGIERWRFLFRGRASHAGTTPMDVRRDAGLAAAALALEAERIAETHGGVATVGSLQLRPGAATIVPGEANLVADLRHREAGALSEMLDEVEAAAQGAAEGRGCECIVDRIWRIDPIEFDPGLVEQAQAACKQVAGSDRVLVSGALHDAAEIARKLPAAMLFVRSIGGVSHSPAENSSDEDLELGIRAYAELAERAMARDWPA
jgi:N-carbamoyl-L-amino-acid hydrolase